jgi:hypothetical protein
MAMRDDASTCGSKRNYKNAGRYAFMHANEGHDEQIESMVNDDRVDFPRMYNKPIQWATGNHYGNGKHSTNFDIGSDDNPGCFYNF